MPPGGKSRKHLHLFGGVHGQLYHVSSWDNAGIELTQPREFFSSVSEHFI